MAQVGHLALGCHVPGDREFNHDADAGVVVFGHAHGGATSFSTGAGDRAVARTRRLVVVSAASPDAVHRRSHTYDVTCAVHGPSRRWCDEETPLYEKCRWQSSCWLSAGAPRSGYPRHLRGALDQT